MPRGWLPNLARNIGLFVHNVKNPEGETKVLKREVEEEKRGKVTLRRTTIEEIEITEDKNG